MSNSIKLNLGAGSDIRQGYINIDIRPIEGIDVVADLGTVHKMFTGGDEILAYDVIEHFSHTEHEQILMNWFGMLKPGGKMIVRCPNPKSICWGYIEKIIQKHAGQENLLRAAVEFICLHHNSNHAQARAENENSKSLQHIIRGHQVHLNSNRQELYRPDVIPRRSESARSRAVAGPGTPACAAAGTFVHALRHRLLKNHTRAERPGIHKVAK